MSGTSSSSSLSSVASVLSSVLPSSLLASTPPPTRVVLLSLDGYGYRREEKGNAVKAGGASIERLSREYRSGLLSASGVDVGLPDGEMGNSEVGHLTMGSGRVTKQPLVLINDAAANKTLADNPILRETIRYARSSTKRVHLIGLLSDGGVHSHIAHVEALLEALKSAGVNDVFVHAILDGRDTPPKSALKFIERITAAMERIGVGRLVDVVGRHFAMDRDKRFDRIAAAYDLYTAAKGDSVDVNHIRDALDAHYKSADDQTVPPISLDRGGIIREGDTVILFNFRNDRMRQLAEALAIQRHFTPAATAPTHLRVVCMVEYDETFHLPVLFTTPTLTATLSEVISQRGFSQFHVAETEKYAHVTFFFNGGRETAFPLEDRKLVPSPHVRTYDLRPEMSMREVADHVLTAMSNSKYGFILCNLAGADMVGHTGHYEATVTAVKTVDSVVSKIADAAKGTAWTVVVTGDHGNAEEMIDESGAVKTSHTCNPVPVILIADRFKRSEPRNTQSDHVDGTLSDVAPTVLALLGLPQPHDMTGRSLCDVLK